jgi:hypothetical protein
LTESVGEVGIEVPRHRTGTFGPQLVRKRQAAPDLGAWSHLKRVPGQPGQAQHRCSDRPGEDRLKKMQYRPGLLDGFLVSTGLDLTPFSNPANKDGFVMFAVVMWSACAR